MNAPAPRSQPEIDLAKIAKHVPLPVDLDLRTGRLAVQLHAAKQMFQLRMHVEMSKVTIIVTGETGSGKSAIAGEIEIALKAIGVPVEWKDADREWWQKGNEYWIDLYKPEVTIIEKNTPASPVTSTHSRTPQEGA